MNLNMILYVIIYSFIGWICECVYCSIGQKQIVNRGFLTGPFCPIYGFGAVSILWILQFLPSSILAVFIGGMIITSSLEYVTSYFMEKIFNSKWWDYSDKRFNINGRVCLLNSSIFALMCVVLCFDIHPYINAYIISLQNEFKAGFLVGFSVYFIIDLSISTYTAFGINSKVKRLHEIRTELEVKYMEHGTRLELEKFMVRIRGLNIHDELLDEFNKKIKNIHFFERRLISAFPQMEHKKHPEYIKEIKEIIKQKFNELNEKHKK